MMNVKFLFIIGITFLLGGCSTKKQDTLFEELPSSYTGVDFINKIPERSDFNIFNYRNFYNGGGVAIGDVNNDGLPDLFLTANFEKNKLYLNKGNMQFEDISEKAGITGKKFWSTGVTMADVNGDGRLDIYVCNSGSRDKRGNELYINQGTQQGIPVFKEQAEAYGLANGGFTTHAVFFDYDRDGDLDMYCLNNSFTPMDRLGYANLRAQRDSLGGDKLYRNDRNHFTDVSQQAGIYGSLIGFGLGVTVGDLNNDNWPDIYVSNDFYERDYLYINQHNGTFKEALEEQMGHTSLSSMGSDIADINNDGLPDLFVTEMFPESDERVKQTMMYESNDFFEFKEKQGYYYQYMRNMFQLNNGDGTFSEVAQQLGIHATDWSWGGLIFDMDNDGLKDLFVANGIMKDLTDQDYIAFLGDEHTMQQMLNGKKFDYKEFVDKMTSTPVPNYAFKNMGNLQFKKVSTEFGIEGPGFSNGSAYSDLDNDGDMDLVVNNNDAPLSIYRNKTNDASKHPDFLKIKLDGYAQNRFGVGAKVCLFQGKTQQVLQLFPNRGFQSSVDLSLVFGLGNNQAIDSLVVVWNDDAQQTLRQVQANQTLLLKHTNAQERFVPAKVSYKPLFTNQTTATHFDYVHQENPFVDFNRDGLLKQKYSTQGPALATGDINGDGSIDAFVGGANTQPKYVYFQQKNGQFRQEMPSAFQPYLNREVVDALLFDADQDQDLDLYWVTGSNEYTPNSPALEDVLFLNDGKGNFTAQALPPIRTSGSCVKACDFDADGDTDLFVGSRLVPSKYGIAPPSVLLKNDGHGHFSDASLLLGDAQYIGMVTDAAWVDLDKDRFPELVLVGDWMPVTILKNQQGKRFQQQDLGLDNLKGWWNCMSVADVDEDGDEDFVLGNWGLNHHFKANVQEPATLFVNDFDKNGSTEQIMTCFHEGRPCPAVLKADLQKQLPDIKEKFLKFSDYSTASMEDLFDSEQLETAKTWQVNNTQSAFLLNDGKGKFRLENLPLPAQSSPIFAIQCTDFDHDGHLDIFLAGNFYDVLPEIGRYDASYGTFLHGLGKGKYEMWNTLRSGLRIKGQVRKMRVMGSNKLVLLKNNDAAELYGF